MSSTCICLASSRKLAATARRKVTGEPSLACCREEHWGEGAHSLLETVARPEPEVTWGKVVTGTASYKA